MNQAALRAETDQVIAELAAKRRDPDPVLVVQLNLAAFPAACSGVLILNFLAVRIIRLASRRGERR